MELRDDWHPNSLTLDTSRPPRDPQDSNLRVLITSSPMTSRSKLVFPVEALDSCELVVNATYLSGDGTLADEPLNRILKCGNLGGFRARGAASARELVVLYTTLADPDWPDSIDSDNGRFVYFGDNKTPGHELHDTPRGGNTILRETFEALHRQPHERNRVPPFFVFSKTGRSRDVRFVGLAAPGASGVTETDDLIAFWKTSASGRFQNYRAIFSILDAPVISRPWLDSIIRGEGSLGKEAPDAWREWVLSGSYRVLRAR